MAFLYKILRKQQQMETNHRPGYSNLLNSLNARLFLRVFSGQVVHERPLLALSLREALGSLGLPFYLSERRGFVPWTRTSTNRVRYREHSPDGPLGIHEPLGILIWAEKMKASAPSTEQARRFSSS
jgi:hypothetical protein